MRKRQRTVFAEKKTILWLCFLLLATCLVGLSKYLFEGRLFVFYDIGSDTWQQYISLYAAISRKIASGDLSLWSGTIGMGTGIFMLNPTNPALVIVYLLGAVFGTGIIPRIMIFLYIAQIFSAGIVAYLYLSTFSFREIPKLLAAYMYAFSGFMIVWGQHYQFAIVPTLLMLELLMAERCLKHRRWAGLVVSTAVTVFSSMYVAYMILLFTGIYVLIRVFMSGRGFGRFLKESLRVLWPAALGVCLAMVTLLPSAYSIFCVSARMQQETPLLSRLFFLPQGGYVQAVIERFFSCAGQGINEDGAYLNYYEGPCLFFSTLFIPVLWQYICLLPGRKISKKRKILAVVLFFAGILVAFTPTAGTVFNGFTLTFNRYMFLFMAAFAILSAVTLEEIFGKRRFSILGAFLASVSMVFGYGWLILGELEPRLDIILIAHMLGGTAMLFLLKVGSAGDSIYADFAPRRTHSLLAFGVKHIGVLLSLILLSNVAAEMTANFRTRGSLEQNDIRLTILEDPYVQESLDKLRADDPEWYRVEKLYGATDAMDAAFQGYHGIGNYCSTLNANVFDFIKSEWVGLILWDYNHTTYRTHCFEQEFSRLLGVRYLLVKEGYLDWYNGGKTYGTRTIPEGFSKYAVIGDVVIYRDREAPGLFSYYSAAAVSDNSVNFENREKDARIEAMSGSRESDVRLSVSDGSDGLLFAAIPYELGWKAWVDGAEAEIVPAETGFSGIRLSAGKHEVRLAYDCPGFGTGAVISLITAAVFAVLLILSRGRRVREMKQILEEEKEQENGSEEWDEKGGRVFSEAREDL